MREDRIRPAGFLAFILLAGISLLPIAFMLVLSLLPQAVYINVSASPPSVIENLTLANFGAAVQRIQFFQRASTSLIVATVVVGLSALVGLPAAQAIANLKTSQAMRLSSMFLAVRLLPPIAIGIPIFAVFHQHLRFPGGLSYLLLQTGLSIPLLVWLAVPVFAGVGRRVLEEAAMDGLAPSQVLLVVLLPVLSRRLIGVLLIIAVIVWNESFFSSVFGVRTVTEAIPSLIGHRGVQWPLVMAVGALVTLPALAVAILGFQAASSTTRQGREC